MKFDKGTTRVRVELIVRVDIPIIAVVVPAVVGIILGIRCQCLILNYE